MRSLAGRPFAARLAVLGLACALVATGCGADEDPVSDATTAEKVAAGSDGPTPAGSPNGKGSAKMKGAKGGPGKKTRLGPAAKKLAPPRAKPGDQKPGGTDPKALPEKDIPGHPKKPRIVDGKPVPHAIVTDLAGDPEGEGSAPAYMDLRHVQIERHGREIVASLRFNAPLPKRMPDEQTTMLTSIDVKRGEEESSVYAEATSSGWRAHSNRSDDFPGSLSLRGNTLTLRFPVQLTGKRFAWYSHSSWTRSTLLETDYFFDFAPDDQKGKFPSREVR